MFVIYSHIFLHVYRYIFIFTYIYTIIFLSSIYIYIVYVFIHILTYLFIYIYCIYIYCIYIYIAYIYIYPIYIVFRSYIYICIKLCIYIYTSINIPRTEVTTPNSHETQPTNMRMHWGLDTLPNENVMDHNGCKYFSNHGTIMTSCIYMVNGYAFHVPCSRHR